MCEPHAEFSTHTHTLTIRGWPEQNQLKNKKSYENSGVKLKAEIKSTRIFGTNRSNIDWLDIFGVWFMKSKPTEYRNIIRLNAFLVEGGGFGLPAEHSLACNT